MYIGVIGNGQAGGNIADLFAKEGFETIAINYSSRDLESLQYVENKLALLGSEGTGKDRDFATNLMKDNWETTLNFIKKNMSKPSVEIILVVYSTSGGSGSGISNLLIDLIKNEMPEKVIVACPILPSNEEALVNLINTQSALEELLDIDISVFPIDNQSIANITGKKLPKNIIYNNINTTFVRLIKTIASYTELNSKNGIIDRKDLKQLLSTKGVSIVAEANLLDISNTKIDSQHFIDTIQNSWKQTIFSPIQFEQIIRAGIIFDGNEKLMEFLHYDKLFDMFKNIPIDMFEGNFNDNNGGKVISILSGLNWIYKRVKELDELIEKHKTTVQSIESTFYKSTNTNKKSIFETVIKQKNPIPKNRSVMDILSKYSN